jgi:hypothetical protein
MMKRNISIIACAAVLIILSLPHAANAEVFSDVTITRVAPSQAFIGQKIWIALVLENMGSSAKVIALNESLAAGANFNQSGAQYIQTAYGEKLWRYEWKIMLAAYENTTVAYWLVPGVAGTYVIAPASVTINGQGFRLKSHSIDVRCNANNACEPGENYLNCREDCGTGSNDGICDFYQDGRCDPDCGQRSDPDCKSDAGGFPANGTNMTGKDNSQSVLPVAVAAIILLAAVAAAFAFIRFRKK